MLALLIGTAMAQGLSQEIDLGVFAQDGLILGIPQVFNFTQPYKSSNIKYTFGPDTFLVRAEGLHFNSSQNIVPGSITTGTNATTKNTQIIVKTN